jgi:hypothetical protein
MTPIERLWHALEQSHDIGGSRRVDDVHASDFYCSLDGRGQRGLVLLSAVELTMPPPRFDSVEIIVGHRGDGRWSLALWLTNSSLSVVFTLLCQDLVDATRDLQPINVPGFVVTRLLRWRRLLESGSANILPLPELRGLIGELIVLKRCLDFWTPSEVVDGWQGPLDAPQDFALPSLLLEVKAVQPTSTAVRISSAEQLEVLDGRALQLAIVALAGTASTTAGTFCAPELVREVETAMAHDVYAVSQLAARLNAGGYAYHDDYEQHRFRVESIRFFSVTGTFPRIVRSQLMPGVTGVLYDISLAACKSFEVALETH